MSNRIDARALKQIMCVMAVVAVGAAAPQVRAQTGDAQPGPDRTLEQLLAFAADNAPELARAQTEVGLGEAAVAEAHKIQPFNPEVDAEFGVGLDEAGLASVEVGLTQRLEVAGQRGLRIDAATRRQEVLEAKLEQARWQVFQEVHRLYRAGLLTSRRAEVERQSVDFTAELLEIATQRYEAGEEPRTSVVVSRAEHARSRQRLVRARLAHREVVRQLATHIGWGQDAPPEPAGELARLEELPATDELVELAYGQDPQLIVLDAQRQRARASLALAEREVWPNPVVGLGFERERMGTEQPESKLLVLAGLPLPLWDRNQGEIAEAQTRAAVFDQAIANRKVELEGRVSTQADAVQSGYEQAEIYHAEVLPALENQLEMLQEGFELGEMSLLDVMSARDRLLGVQRQHLEVLDEYFNAISELERAIGTPIWRDQDQRNDEDHTRRQ